MAVRRQDLISVAIVVPLTLALGIWAGLSLNDNEPPSDSIYWSCNLFWEGPLAGGGKHCEAPLIYGTYLRYQTGWASPDIGSLARDVPTNDIDTITRVALLTNKIYAKTDHGAYYIIAFELLDNGRHRKEVSGPMDESSFVQQTPDTTLNWMPVHIP